MENEGYKSGEGSGTALVPMDTRDEVMPTNQSRKDPDSDVQGLKERIIRIESQMENIR